MQEDYTAIKQSNGDSVLITLRTVISINPEVEKGAKNLKVQRSSDWNQS